MNTRPHARPRRTDIVAARPRPLTTVSLAVQLARGAFWFHAVDGERSWSGRTDSPNRDTGCWTRCCGCGRRARSSAGCGSW